jgi:hypothetical protein
MLESEHDRISGGLSEAEAAERLRNDGPNELASAKAKGNLRIAVEVLREPMFLRSDGDPHEREEQETMNDPSQQAYRERPGEG